MLRPTQSLPSALDCLEEIRHSLGAKPAIFLDYDGTLTPIVNDPVAANLDGATRKVIERVARRVPVSIVSGRSAVDVRDRVGLGDVIYAGSHGQEIEFPGGRRFENPDSLRAVPSLAEAERLLRSRLVGLAGIAVERKPFAIAVHTRNAVSEAARVSAGLITSNLAEEVGGLVVRKGKEIHEVRPDVDWDKGRAIQYLMGLVDGHTPLFVGDDDTDEDGFAVVREAGGVGVIVAVGDERLTSADYRIDLQGGVVEFLAGF